MIFMNRLIYYKPIKKHIQSWLKVRIHMETVRHRKELLMKYIIIVKRSEIYKIIKSKWGESPYSYNHLHSRGVLIEIMNFAHRGSLTEAPENTISAIKKALEHGAKGIELDVQLT